VVNIFKKIFRRLEFEWTVCNKKIQNLTRRIRLERNFRENIANLQRLRKALSPDQKITAIFLTEHFGDIIACEPVIRHVRARYPKDIVVWFTYKRFLQLLEHHPELKRVFSVTCLTECKMLMESGLLDRVVDLHIGPRPCHWFGTFHYTNKFETEVTVFNHYNYGSILEAFSKAAGLGFLSDAPRVYIPSAVHDSVAGIAPHEPFLVIHAASNVAARDWKDEKWKLLVEKIINKYSISIVEVGLQSRVANQVPGVQDMCSKLSLLQLGELIRRASGFVGIDSGPAHFANAFKCPSVILLGHYLNYQRYMPYNGYLREHALEMLLYWDGPARDIPVDDVERKIEENLKFIK
jgi:heptosyltransferase-3